MFFTDVVKITKSGCKLCFTFIYTLPVNLSADVEMYLSSFGKSELPLSLVKFLKITTPDQYKIEGKLDTNTIKFGIPKKFEKGNPDINTRKYEFENALSQWLTKKLDIPIRPTPSNLK